MLICRQSTARTVTVGPVLDADGVAVTDCVVADFEGSVNGGDPAALNGSATLTHRGVGFYSLALTATDLATVGSFEVCINDTVNACPMKELTVIEEAVYDAMFAASAPGYLQPTTAGRTLDVTATGAAGVDWGNVENKTTANVLSGTEISPAQRVDVETIKTQAVSCPAGVTVGEFVGNANAAIAVSVAGLVTFGNTSIATVTTATNVTTVNGLAANVITAASIANGAIDAATFAADVDAEFLSYIVDDATRIDASALNTATGTTIPTNLDATVSSRSTLTQTQVTGGAYSVQSASCVLGDARIANLDAAVSTRGTSTVTTAQVQTECEEALQTYHLDHLIASADPGAVVANSSFLAKLVSKSATPAFADFDNTTESLQALRDRGDAAWITATGFSTHTAADVWAVATRVLTAGTNINGSTFTAIPWAAAWDAEVQSEVADALAVFWTSPATLVDLVWDEALSGHATAGTAGAALSAANAPTAAAVATAVWTDTTASDFTTLTSPGKIIFGQLGGAFTTTSSSVFTIAALANGPSGAGGSASAIADAVWDELLADHSTAGSAGQLLYDALQAASAAAGSSASSSSTAYAVHGDLTARYDIRAVRQLASDTDTPVAAADLGDSTRVSKALLSASGMVEAACTAGKRYMPADLAALTGASKEFLKDIVCDLAMGRLWMSRPTESGEPPRCWSEAQKILEKLGSGLYVFGMSGAQEAGNLDVQREYAAGVETRDMQTSQAERFFGRRSNRVK